MVKEQVAKLAISSLVGFKRGPKKKKKSSNLSPVGLDFPDSLVNV